MASRHPEFARRMHAFYAVGKTRVSLTCTKAHWHGPTSPPGSINGDNCISIFLISDCVVSGVWIQKGLSELH
eukprot:5951283-Pyramimonas_sp.AAC.1